METTSPSLGGAIAFSTVGRTEYGFDIFSLPLSNISLASEHRLTDGVSINFNGHFVDDNQTLVFVSERSGSPSLYLTRPNSSSPPEQLPSAPGSLFHDRPILHQNNLFFISTHEPPNSLYKSWSALYYYSYSKTSTIHRLTPFGVSDFSPALSPCGKYLAVASYGSKPWSGDFHELQTHIVVFPISDPSKRIVLAERGGWPTWSAHSTIYFHRQDQWWSIYEVPFPLADSESPRRITPPGLHAFTPAAFQDGKRIVVATRRQDNAHRHIEIFDIESGKFEPVTELVNPEFHHYNPFVSPGSNFIGYHRFRGSDMRDKRIPNLEPILSPIKSLKMLRTNGQFPAFSPKGDLIAYNHDLESKGGLKIMKSDGTKRWTLMKGKIAFYNSWCCSSDKNKHVIFTSLGSIFQPPQVSVQVARISFKASSLKPDSKEVENVDVKIMTKEETGNNGFPACSPDGKLVVFRSGRSGYKNLYIMDAVDGEDKIRKLTEGAWTDTMPSWSPDGQWIAFSSNRHDASNGVTFGIYMVRADGSELRRVNISEVGMERNNHVCFSPNGEWLLFTSNMGGVTAEPISFLNQFQLYGDLFIVRVDGSGLRRLTCNGYENGTPAWHSNHTIAEADPDLEVDADEITGRFQEPLWITFDF